MMLNDEDDRAAKEREREREKEMKRLGGKPKRTEMTYYVQENANEF